MGDYALNAEKSPMKSTRPDTDLRRLPRLGLDLLRRRLRRGGPELGANVKPDRPTDPEQRELAWRLFRSTLYPPRR